MTNVPVQVSGSNLTSPYSLTPSSNGCTFLALAPGTYSVQVGPGPTSSYVANYDEESSETQALANQSAITVTDAEITEVVFQYDEGSYVGLSYPSTTAIDDGVTCPNSSVLICLAVGQSAASATSPNTSPEAVGMAETSSGWSVATFPASMHADRGGWLHHQRLHRRRLQLVRGGRGRLHQRDHLEQQLAARRIRGHPADQHRVPVGGDHPGVHRHRPGELERRAAHRHDLGLDRHLDQGQHPEHDLAEPDRLPE